MNAPDCPTPQELAALVGGWLSGDGLDRVAAHVDACPSCLAAALACRPAGDLFRVPNEPPTDAAGRYRANGLHAVGGLGEVYLAEDVELGRRVALKRIRPARADDPASRRRFLREAELTAGLEHPGVVPVHGLSHDAGGRPHYAMRFVDGLSLDEAVRAAHAAGRDFRAELRALLTRFVAVCQTVAYAHSRGVVHRDLKPANVMLGPYGETLVVDWGLAKRIGRPDDEGSAFEPEAVLAGETWPGTAIGTPEYMSPEQAAGQTDVGPASDVYGLGATLYAILTGHPPRTGTGTVTAPRRLDRRVPRALDAVCLKALATRPEDRYASAAEVGAEVERWLAGEPVRAYREPLPVRAGRWARRHRVAVVALTVGLLAAAVVGGGAAVWLAREAGDRRAERARLEAKDREAVDRALAELPGLVARWRFREAAGLLDQTAAGLSEFAPPESRGRLDAARSDVRLAARLDEVRREKAAAVGGWLNTAAVAVPAYHAAFAQHGLDCEGGGVADVAGRVRASPVWTALVAGLDDWSAEEPDPSRRGRLAAVAKAADPDEWRDRFRDALAGRDTAALRDLARRADVGRLSPAALDALGMKLGVKTKDAEDLLRRAQARHPGDFWLTFSYAQALMRGERPRPAEAVAFYRACVALRPDVGLAYSDLGVALHQLGDDRGAAEACGRAVEIDPTDVLALNNLGNALKHVNDDEGAEAAFRRAIALAPRFAGPQVNLGNLLLKRGDRAGAEAAYRRAVELDEANPKAQYGLGSTLCARGDFAGGEAALRRAVELDPTHAPAQSDLGNCLYKRGDFAGAEAAYRRAVTHDPRDALVYHNLAQVLLRQNRPDEAIVSARRAVELLPPGSPQRSRSAALVRRIEQAPRPAREPAPPPRRVGPES